MQTKKAPKHATNSDAVLPVLILTISMVFATFVFGAVCASIGFVEAGPTRDVRVAIAVVLFFLIIAATISIFPLYDQCINKKNALADQEEPQAPSTKKECMRACTSKRDEILSRETDYFEVLRRGAIEEGQPALIYFFNYAVHQEYLERRIQQWRDKGFRATRREDLEFDRSSAERNIAYEVYWGYEDSPKDHEQTPLSVRAKSEQ